MPRGDPLRSARGHAMRNTGIVYERALPSHTDLKQRAPINHFSSQAPQVKSSQPILMLDPPGGDSDAEEMEDELARIENDKNVANGRSKTYPWMFDTPFNLENQDSQKRNTYSILDKYVD